MRIAIVGCGVIAEVHAECIRQIEGQKLIAVADINIDKAERFAKRFKANAYNSIETMMEHETFEVLHICTPHYLHTPMAIYAMNHGLHVFMEKPPVISKEQWVQLKGLETNYKLGLCFQNRYNPSVLYVKSKLESKEAGEILGARGLVTWQRNEAYYLDSEWRGRLETEGGGVLINQSIHTMDLLAYFLGKPISVDATMSNHHLKSVVEVEDTMEALIEFEQGKKACFYATTAYCHDAPALLELHCEKMTIRIEDNRVYIYHKDGTVEIPSIDERLTLGKSYWGAGHRDCISDFYESIEQNTEFALELSKVENTIDLMLAAYESARTGRGEINVKEL